LDLVARDPNAYRVIALTANTNVSRLVEQARRLRPSLAVIGDPDRYGELREGLFGTGVEAAAGAEALIDAASRPADWIMAAIVGAAGLPPTMAAIRQGTILAIANKECLVSAGPIVVEAVAEHGATMLPVDSEHNAIFQVFDTERRDKIERIILTASGGPFRDLDTSVMAHVTPAQAVAHPNWSMGPKISVDSATMMNKGLELIEAHHLFGMAESAIDILIHPQSIVHSLVAYVDGSVLAQLGTPDMRTPIAYTLGWPDRISAPSSRLDLAALKQLTFEEPDPVRFPALRLAREALQTGGGAPTILNAANEVAVGAFLEGRISFLDIARIVEETLSKTDPVSIRALDDVFAVDRAARQTATEMIASS
jgi:1-deoxy-D-xylulose-5-phosphate reductoisomerase